MPLNFVNGVKIIDWWLGELAFEKHVAHKDFNKWTEMILLFKKGLKKGLKCNKNA